jgi:hypothetical protein
MIRFVYEREKSPPLRGEDRQENSKIPASGNRYPLPL